VGEAQISSIMTLREMIPAPRHRGERHVVALALVLHDRAALGDGELGSAIDSRRGGLHEVCVGHTVLGEAEREVPRGLHVVVLGVVGPLAIEIRVRRGGLGGEMQDRARLVDLQHLVDERPLGEVPLDEREVAEAVHLACGRQSFVDARDRDRAPGSDLLDPPPAREVVHDHDPLVGPLGDAQGGRPPDVAVAPCHDDAH